jgi:hypothetical protein
MKIKSQVPMLLKDFEERITKVPQGIFQSQSKLGALRSNPKSELSPAASPPDVLPFAFPAFAVSAACAKVEPAWLSMKNDRHGYHMIVYI